MTWESGSSGSDAKPLGGRVAKHEAGRGGEKNAIDECTLSPTPSTPHPHNPNTHLLNKMPVVQNSSCVSAFKAASSRTW